MLLLLSLLIYAAECNRRDFPPHFKFGVATAAFQVEGAWNTSGKGENIWDRYTHENPQKISDHSNGDVACDSYRLFRRDVEMLAELGVNYYRFSLSWSRILPEGHSNRVNRNGVGYYNELIDQLISRNIEPMVTLFHWDLPQPLQDLGGWTNELTADYFTDYATLCFTLFGDRVKTWITFNEPPDFCGTYEDGVGAPGISQPGIGYYLCGKNVLIAHARAWRTYDTQFRSEQKGKVGITLDMDWFEPKTKESGDAEASERAMQMLFGFFAHPIYSSTGDYPRILTDRVSEISLREGYPRSRLPPLTTDEVDLVRGTGDFFGLNHYTSRLVEDDVGKETPPSKVRDAGVRMSCDPAWKTTAAEWLRVVPWGFRKTLAWIRREYGQVEVIVTENGYASGSGRDDEERIGYMKDYLENLLDAYYIDGVNVTAYTAWSLMDNMEWSDGYTIKFGLYGVDFDDVNRTRTMRMSGGFYKRMIEERKLPDTDGGSVVNV